VFAQGRPRRAAGWREGLPLSPTVHGHCLCYTLPQHVAVSSGSGQNDLERMSRILEAVPQVKFICLDVANGYSEHFVEFVKLVRSKFPEHTIMVSLMGCSQDEGPGRRGVLGPLPQLLLEEYLQIHREETGGH
jgi:hypothetical protein